MRRTATGAIVALLLIGMSFSAFDIRPVRATGTIYIKLDGSVDPITAPIQRDGDTYTFTGDIYDSNLEVLKDNIVIDGAGHKIEGLGNVNGIMVSSVSGLKIKNIKIKGFRNGIAYSSNNSIIGNRMTGNLIGLNLLSGNFVTENEIESSTAEGIRVQPQCMDNTIAGNNISLNAEFGVNILVNASQNVICNNTIVANGAGIFLSNYTKNIVTGNYIAENTYGINSEPNSADNWIYHNNFISNVHQSYISQSQSENTWDYGYPAGGNYWSDYAGVDLRSGPCQNETGGDGIGDVQYVIDDNNRDNYPLIYPWSPLPVHNINTGLGYATVQEAIDATETLDKHAIFVEAGTYYEHLVVNKILSLIGDNNEATIIDGSNNGYVVDVVALNVTISQFTLQNAGSSWSAVNIEGSGAMVRDNLIINNYGGVWVQPGSLDVTIAGNRIFNRQPSYADGIRLWSSGTHVVGNIITNESSGMKLDGSGNIVEGNLITDNLIGIGYSSDNLFFHNSFVNNDVQATALGINIWDDDYPSGGNYWSDYIGADADGDGIGDTPYFFDSSNEDNYPLMNPWTPPYIAVVNFTVSKAVVGEGFSLSVNLTVENKGNKIEAFNISVCAGASLIESQMMFLTGGTSTILAFEWNTAGFARGNYTMSAHLELILNETNIGDNNYNGSSIFVTVPGDVTGDGWADMQDISILIDAFMVNSDDPRWNSNCDINNDLNIDMVDVSIAIDHFLQ